MKKHKIIQGLEYLRYGHREGIVEVESKEEALAMVEDDPYGYLRLIISDFEVDDCGDVISTEHVIYVPHGSLK